MIVETDWGELHPPGRCGSPSFRFEAGWVQEEQFGVIVNNAWRLSMDVRGGKVREALQDVALDLQVWSRNVLGDLEKRLKKTRKALEKRRGSISRNLSNRIELLKFKLERLEEQKNMYWRQQGKVHWLDKGDRNTKFFHQYASERKRRNRIWRIVLEDGRVMEEERDMLAAVTNLYRDLFTSQAGGGTEELL